MYFLNYQPETRFFSSKKSNQEEPLAPAFQLIKLDYVTEASSATLIT